MKVYKYIQSTYKTAINYGFIYLNTFSSIRGVEESNLIGDRNEGISSNYIDNLLIDDSSSVKHAKAINDLSGHVKIGNGVKGLSFSNCRFTNLLPDAYMFCVTSKKNDTYWKSKCLYDVCYEIDDFYKFSESISIALFNQGIPNRFKINECFYDDNAGVIGKAAIKPSYFTKLPKYNKQYEVRAVFVPEQKIKIMPRTLWIKPNYNASFV